MQSKDADGGAALDLAQLENAKQTNGKLIARCPACKELGRDEKGDHLCIGVDGRFGCVAFPGDGEHRKRIFALVGVKGETTRTPTRKTPKKQAQTWPDLQAAADAVTPAGFKLAAVYPNGDGAGVARYESETGKTFRQFNRDGDKWQTGGPAGRWALFGKIQPEGVVFIVEGEKCQQAAESIGLPCVTSAGGSAAAAKTDWEPLAGRDVVIMPDNDPPGESYAGDVAKILRNLDPPSRVRILRLSGLPEGGDLADWIDQRDAQDPAELKSTLERMATDAPEMEGDADELAATDAADYLESEPPPIDPIVDGLFECGDKVELIGGSKRRKSFAAIELAVHVAQGRDWLGLHIPTRRRVVYVNLELKAKWIHRRIRRTCRALGVDPSILRGWLLVVNARGKGATVRARLVEIAKRDRAELVIVDPRYKLHLPGEAENAGEGVAGILDLFDRVAESGPAVLVVHHDPKGDSGDRAIQDRGGGSSWAGRDVDARLTLTPQKTDPEGASVVSVMVRNFPPMADFCIRWADDRFHLDGELMPLPFTSWDRRKAIQGGGATRTAESFDAVALDVARKPMSRNELLCKIQAAGASRDLARACVERLVRDGEIVHTPRAGAVNGAVKYGLPSVLKEYTNPRLAV